MAHAVRALTEAGQPDVTLWVLEANEQARRFYVAAGFRPDGARQLLDLGGPVTEVRYQLTRRIVTRSGCPVPPGPPALTRSGCSVSSSCSASCASSGDSACGWRWSATARA